MTNETQTTQPTGTASDTGAGSVADVTSTGDSAQVELNNAIAEGVFPGTSIQGTNAPANYSTADTTGAMSYAAPAMASGAVAAAQRDNDATTHQKLTDAIVAFDPVEFSNEVSGNRASLLASAIMSGFDLFSKTRS